MTQTVLLGVLFSAFLGAFFAFLFTRVGTLADRLFARRQKHRTALVKLETQGNKYLNILGDNLFVINDFSSIAKKHVPNHQPFLYFNELHPFPIDRTITRDLGNLDIKNDLFSFEATIAKTNSSVRTVNKFLTTIQEAFINKNIDPATYFTNVHVIAEKLAELAVFMHDLEKENKVLIAKARILLYKSNKSPYILLLSRVMNKSFTEKQKQQIPKEVRELEKEIAKTSSDDRKRIDKLLELMEQKQ